MVGTIIAKKNVRAAFDAMNRHDLETFLATWDANGVFVYPGDIHASGRFEGKSAVEGWFQGFFNQFPSIRFEIHDMCAGNSFDFTGNNVIAVCWDLFLTNKEGREGRNSGVTVITIKGGKVALAQDFIFDLGENFRMNWSAGKRAKPAPLKAKAGKPRQGGKRS